MEQDTALIANQMEENKQSDTNDLKRKAEDNEDEEGQKQDGSNDYEPSVKCTKLENTVVTDSEPFASVEQNCEIEETIRSVSNDDSNKEEGVLASEHSTEDGMNLADDTNKSSSENKFLDPLGYTKAEAFTSEVFKIQIHNLPKFGFSQLKKRFVSLGLKPHKFKSPRPEVTYVCFRNEEDRQEALKKINGHVWKGKTLEAKEAAPIVDPFLQKKQQQRTQNTESSTTDSMVTAREEPLTPEEAQKRLKDSVAPLWNVDYTKQLETKTEKIKKVLKNLTHHHFLRDQFRQSESWKQDGLPCPLLPIIPSPVISEYRNKNEFTIGYSSDGKTVKVGFRFGMYKDGTTTVGDCTNLGVVRPAAVSVIESFEKFVSQSRWPPFLQQTATGHWHTLTVRTFDTGDVMTMVDFHPRKLDETEIESAKNSIKEYYMDGDGKDVGIKSFYFRLHGKGPAGVERLQNIFGEQYVYESLLGLKFRISPEAFFQVNTKATEGLYSLIGEWCQFSQSSTILDICCGTGTIGLSMAKKVKQVIGVEMCKPAVQDAEANAILNDITNVRYYCSKVEDVISKILSSVNAFTSSSSSPPTASLPTESTDAETDAATSSPEKPDVIAVVDPPRAGLHKSVIKTLRKSEGIERLVYVSCNPESAMENFVDLVRPSTGKLKGKPFSLVKAIPVDLFPGTRHCELVLLLTR